MIEALQLLPLKPEDPAGPAAAGRFRNALSEVKRYFPPPCPSGGETRRLCPAGGDARGTLHRPGGSAPRNAVVSLRKGRPTARTGRTAVS
ncbi:MAG: hypothetical protein L6W00_22355 [Lentisphaeria bacterium]|nr:MAG: hypothetical protein L6W00_22355 [Lentisphaeria bacterium]